MMMYGCLSAWLPDNLRKAKHSICSSATISCNSNRLGHYSKHQAPENTCSRTVQGKVVLALPIPCRAGGNVKQCVEQRTTEQENFGFKRKTNSLCEGRFWGLTGPQAHAHTYCHVPAESYAGSWTSRGNSIRSMSSSPGLPQLKCPAPLRLSVLRDTVVLTIPADQRSQCKLLVGPMQKCGKNEYQRRIFAATNFK
jgi:hypothetical protein